MKETERKLLNSTWQKVLHYSVMTTFLIIIITLPILYTKTGTPPFWVICLIVGLFLLFYILFMSLLFVRKNAIPNENVHDQQDQDEIIRLQSHHSSHSTIQSQRPIDERRTVYNSSTIGIPPSSFLAPTVQTSIRSSSLDFVPPPPAYQDMIYPPSYRSTHSTKDDNVSIVY